MKKNTSILTRGAMLLALALIFQSLKLIFPMIPPQIMQILMGSLVNMVLLLAAYYCGLGVAVTIAVVTPVMALITGQLPNAWFIPCIAAGSAVYAVLFYALKGRVVHKGLYQKASAWTAMIVAALAKFGVLYLLMVVIAIPAVIKNPDAIKTLSAVFSFTQLITAICGGVVALVLTHLIPGKVEAD